MGDPPRVPSLVGPGERVGHYEILEELGRGGMGVVYRARDVTLNRPVALKCPLPVGDQAPGHRKRLLREARAAARLSHPHIVPIYEVLEHRGIPWLAMELVDGATLRGLLAVGRPLPMKDVLRYTEGLASALEAAHSLHILHRDISPNNIMVTRDGRAVLTDFGLARFLAVSEKSSTRSRDSDFNAQGKVVGTVRYMSPEQALGKPLDARSDLFSIGAVVYEMATGKPAVSGSGAEVLDTLLHRPPVAMSRLNYDVPEELERIVRKCLAKDPGDRYQGARDLLVDVRALRRKLDHAAYAQSLETNSWTGRAWPLRPRPGRRAAAVLGVAALVVVATIGAWQSQRILNPPRPPTPVGTPHSLAFVPFQDATNDPAWEHLIDGVTDDLTRELQASGVPMKARESAGQLRGLSDAEIARRFGVDRVGRGRISLVGGDILLDTWVAQANTGAQVWRRTYRQPLEHLGGLYVAVANDIAGLTGERPVRGAGTEARNRRLDAYKEYYRGRYYWGQRTRDGLRTSINYFRAATDLDPSYAQAWAGMADGYLGLGVPTFGALHPKEARRLAKAAAVEGNRVGPDVAEVQASLAHVTYAYDWNWPEAERLYRKAIALNPQYATAHQWYEDYLTAMGRPQEATREIRAAAALEPGSAAIQRDLAWPYFFQRRYALAIDSLATTLQSNPGFTAARSLLGRALIEAGRPAEGLAEMKRIEPDLPRPAAAAFVAYAEAANGQPTRAEASLRDGLRTSGEAYASPYLIALVYAKLGRAGEALRWLEKGFDDHDPLMTTLMVDPRFDPVRQEPRFQMLIRKMNFPRSTQSR